MSQVCWPSSTRECSLISVIGPSVRIIYALSVGLCDHAARVCPFHSGTCFLFLVCLHRKSKILDRDCPLLLVPESKALNSQSMNLHPTKRFFFSRCAQSQQHFRTDSSSQIFSPRAERVLCRTFNPKSLNVSPWS